jgi:hypothetical protein
MSGDSRTVVKTYVPKYQKDIWIHHADELGMSQSEFIRTMVQAGRVDFEIPSIDGKNIKTNESNLEENTDLKKRIRSVLNQEQVLSWDELIDQLTAEIEEEADIALSHLQDNNRIRYSGREGGYILNDDE